VPPRNQPESFKKATSVTLGPLGSPGVLRVTRYDRCYAPSRDVTRERGAASVVTNAHATHRSTRIRRDLSDPRSAAGYDASRSAGSAAGEAPGRCEGGQGRGRAAGLGERGYDEASGIRDECERLDRRARRMCGSRGARRHDAHPARHHARHRAPGRGRRDRHERVRRGDALRARPLRDAPRALRRGGGALRSGGGRVPGITLRIIRALRRWPVSASGGALRRSGAPLRAADPRGADERGPAPRVVSTAAPAPEARSLGRGARARGRAASGERSEPGRARRGDGAARAAPAGEGRPRRGRAASPRRARVGTDPSARGRGARHPQPGRGGLRLRRDVAPSVDSHPNAVALAPRFEGYLRIESVVEVLADALCPTGSTLVP